MTITAALLDEQGIFLKVDTLKSKAALTERHLPSIKNCDLPPEKYKWVADQANPYGGAFWPLPKLNRAER
jgi:hypothetical protein